MSVSHSKQIFISTAKQLIEDQVAVVTGLVNTLDDRFAAICQCLLDCQGRVIVMGMGKSGHIGSKIAATLASTGTPAFFVHPAEANHGDLGMITSSDVVLMISNSGQTPELKTLLPRLKQLGVTLICLTGTADSVLAKAANLSQIIDYGQEACPLGLAPTSSTTASLVIGDAIAMALQAVKGYTREDFAKSHPGGALGKSLYLKVSDLMITGKDMPVVQPTAPLSEALVEMTSKHLGLTMIVSADHSQLMGVFTDGDVRRVLAKGQDIHKIQVQSVMHQNPVCVAPEMLALDALKQMSEKQITSLVVLGDQGQPIGVLHMHALVKAGLKL
jgi:arabinose-5-phosphate isomerase